MEPSIKGFAMQPAIQRVRRLHAAGVIKDLAEAPGLHPEDVELIEHDPSPTLWYPIALQHRILCVLRDVEGSGDDRYWVTLGRQTAGEILGATAISVIIKGARAFGDRAGAALIRISNLALSMGDWKYEGDGLHDFKVDVTRAAELPESSRLTVQGFIEVLASQFLGESVRCESERPAPDHVVYRGRARSAL